MQKALVTRSRLQKSLQQSQFSKAVKLVIEHHADLSTPEDICNLLQVSTAVRQAVQQATGHLTVNTKTHTALQSVDKLSAFAAWLPKHTGLVRSLHLLLEADSPATANGADSTADKGSPAVSTMLTLALQLCTAPHACGAQAALGAQQLPAPLRLHLFASNSLVSVAVLDVLAWANLRELRLDMPIAAVTSSWCDAVARLKSLESISLSLKGDGVRLPPELAAAVSSLPLHTLDLAAAVDADFVSQLPLSLTELCIDVPVSNDPFNLQHLTALQNLSCFGSGHGVALPPQHLNLLKLDGTVQVKGDVFAARVGIIAKEPAAFAVMPHLCKHASRLHELAAVYAARVEQYDAAWPHAVSALGQLTSLTRLVWHSYVVDGPSVCAQVAKLCSLVSLDVCILEEKWQDIVCMTSLTKLTRLTLSCGLGCTDVAAAALTASLTGLRELYLRGSMYTWTLLPVVARLSELRTCTIRTDSDAYPKLLSLLCPDTLRLLAPLTQLTYLELPIGDACPVEARQQFLAGMPKLGEIVVAPEPPGSDDDSDSDDDQISW